MAARDVTLKQPLLKTNAKSKEIELKDWQGSSGESAPLSQVGYAAISGLKSDEEMARFILHAADHNGLRVSDTAGMLSSVVPFHSGTKATQTFERLIEEMLNAAPLAGTWVSKRSDASVVSLDQDGYAAMACLKDHRQMRAFVLRLATHLGRSVVDNATLEDLLPFHSGEKATQSFDRLSQEIRFSPAFAASPLPHRPQIDEPARRAAHVGAGPAQGVPVGAPVLVGAVPTAQAPAVGRVVSMSVGTGALHIPSAAQGLPMCGAQQQRLQQQQLQLQQAIQQQQQQLRAQFLETGLCSKCAGKGFCHVGPMAHDRPASDPCFFCQECDICCEARDACAAAPAVGATCRPACGRGAQCGCCSGLGFRHVGGMQHDRSPDERCFFCQDCAVCGGTGERGEASSLSGAHAAATPEPTRQGRQGYDVPCGHCQDYGFVHVGQAQHEVHDRPPKEMCFFCQECGNCNGRGAKAR